MRLLVAILLIGCVFESVQAHHPERRGKVPTLNRDLIGPIGNRLKASYRRIYNRPTYVGGKLAYWFVPTSQEAMAWHRAEHRGAYDMKVKARIEPHYFYPKPWETLRVGPRLASNLQTQSTGAATPVPNLKPVPSPSDIRLSPEQPADGDDEMAFGDSESEGRRGDIGTKLQMGNSMPSSTTILDEAVPQAPSFEQLKLNEAVKDAVRDAIGSGLE